MRVIGFNFTKILGEKKADKITQKPSTAIEFLELEKDKVDLLKEGEAIKITFKYSILYSEQEKKTKADGELTFEGDIILSVTKDESKEITKYWKKKTLPAGINLALFNLILKRCTPKAIFLEDEVGLPFHTPMPRLQPKKED